MELPWLAVVAQPAVVVEAVGGVGVLLHLCQQDALADGVNGAGWNKENIAFFYWCMMTDFGNSAILQAVSQFLTGDFFFYAIEQLSTRFGINNIPHFGFALAILLLSYVRENVLEDNKDIPRSFQGAPIVLLTACLMSMAFFGFQGLI